MSDRRALSKRPDPVPDKSKYRAENAIISPRASSQSPVKYRSPAKSSSLPFHSYSQHASLTSRLRTEPLTPTHNSSRYVIPARAQNEQFRHKDVQHQQGLRMRSASEANHVMRRKSNGLSKRTVDTLTLSGYTTLRAIRLMTEDDLRDLDISLGQRSLLRAVVAKLRAEEGRYDDYSGRLSILLMVSCNVNLIKVTDDTKRYLTWLSYRKLYLGYYTRLSMSENHTFTLN